MSFRIDPEEYGLLAGDNCSSLSHEARLVYLLCIRPRMDYETGIAGQGRGRISYQGIAEVLEYAPPKGSTKPPKQYAKEAIRAVLSELERSGLVKWLKTEERGLFFECLRADRESVSKNMNNPRTTPEQPQRNHPIADAMSHPEESRYDGAFIGSEQPQNEPLQQPVPNCDTSPKSNPYPDIRISGRKEVKSPLLKEAILAVFEHWKTTTGHTRAALDDKRKKLIAARLRDYTETDLCKAIDGNQASAWHQGKNADGKVFDSLELILRDAAKVDQFMALATKANVVPIDQAEARRQAAKAMLFGDGGGERVIQGEVVR